jgi:DNA-binding PucR family transcriptional regulator
MTEQNDNPIFDSKKYAQQVSDLVSKITSNKLSKDQLKEAKKSLADIQKMASDAIEKFSLILPDLNASEKRIVDAQKFGIADSVINQIFDKSEDVLNKNEQEQFINLLTKVLKSAPKREQNKIFKGSDDLKEALYLHNDDARREKLKK